MLMLPNKSVQQSVLWTNSTCSLLVCLYECTLKHKCLRLCMSGLAYTLAHTGHLAPQITSIVVVYLKG